MVARRWGTGVAGWLAGLPLTSGPVSLFLAMEQGRSFAKHAAVATLFGLVGIAGFCAGYSLTARDRSWAPSALIGLGAFFALGWLFGFIAAPAAAAYALVCVSLAGTLRLVRWPSGAARAPRSSPWDIPVRAVTATALVLVLTGAATRLGPQVTGVLSPFPIYAGILAAFSHHSIGASAAQLLLRGTLIGCFGFASFFFVVASLVTRMSLVGTYTIATLAALAINSVLLRLVIRPTSR